MERTIQKPSFREVVGVDVTTMNLDDVGLTFNSQRVGPMNFLGLRQADYGQGFRMPTMPELVPLVYASLENKDYKTAENVIRTSKENWLDGNTGILYVPKGMFFQDDSQLKNRRISMNQRDLEAKLGSHEEKGVTFSDDRSIRFVPYGFKTESQRALDLSRNPGIIALTGSEENAEKLARASQHYSINPYFWVLRDVESPQIRVADLGSYYFDVRLYVYADYSEDYAVRCSFGVLKSVEGTRPGK